MVFEIFPLKPQKSTPWWHSRKSQRLIKVIQSLSSGHHKMSVKNLQAIQPIVVEVFKPGPGNQLK